MSLKMSKYPFFADEEFSRCIPPCDVSQMDETFMWRLVSARDAVGLPFVLNSAYRSPLWEQKHDRTARGFHTKGRAVDIRCTSSADRYDIVAALIRAGFKGIGIGKTFIHVDDRDGCQVMFDYYD